MLNICRGCQRSTPRDFCPRCGRTFDGGPDDRDRSPALSGGHPYGLLGPTQLGHGGLPVDARPFACDQLGQLARRIHRERGHDALQLTPERVTFRGEIRDTVRVVAECPISGEARLIGHAWVNGRDWRVLAAALEQHQPRDLGRVGSDGPEGPVLAKAGTAAQQRSAA